MDRITTPLEQSLPHFASLSPEARAQAMRVAERLREAVRAVLSAVPKEAQSVAGLSRLIGIERSTCSRLISAVSADISLSTLVGIPGPGAIRTMAMAIQRVGIIEGARLQAAAMELEQFFSGISGKQRGYARLLTATLDANSTATEGQISHISGVEETERIDLTRRMKMFALAKEMIGRWARVQLSVAIYGPEDAQGVVEVGIVRGMGGHRAVPGAVPLSFSSIRNNGVTTSEGTEYMTLEKANLVGVNTDVPLRKLCTLPLPAIESRVHQGILSYFLNYSPEMEAEETDFFLAAHSTGTTRFEIDKDDKPGVLEATHFLNFPSQALLFDVYLHKTLALRCIPGLDMHLWLANYRDTKDDRWATRVSMYPELTVLGRGTARARSRFYSRHTELTKDAFERMNFNPDDFVGYRCEVEYPAWRLAYRMFFEFSNAKRSQDFNGASEGH